MNAIDHLVKIVGSPHKRPPLRVSVPALNGTATAHLLHLLLCSGPMTTAELAEDAALSTRAVWGLLKGPRAAGQVTHDDGLWEIDADFPGLDVIRAAELLRERGWRVDAPARSTRP